MRLSILALSAFVLWGCAHPATVKMARAPIPVATGNDQQRAREYLVAAEREQPAAALGNDLSAAKLSLNILERRPDDSSAKNIYNFSVARAVENCAIAQGNLTALVALFHRFADRVRSTLQPAHVDK